MSMSFERHNSWQLEHGMRGLCCFLRETPEHTFVLLCGVSDDRCIGLSFVRCLFGGCMVVSLVVLCVPLLLSFLAMPGPLSLSPCNTGTVVLF